MRRRFEWEVRSLKSAASGLLWAMEHQLRKSNQGVSAQIHALRQDLGREFGPLSRMAAALGPLMLWSSRREQRRLARGVTYEPDTVVERRNWVGPDPSLHPLEMRPDKHLEVLAGGRQPERGFQFVR